MRLSQELKESVSRLVVESEFNGTTKLGRLRQVLSSQNVLVEIDNIRRQLAMALQVQLYSVLREDAAKTLDAAHVVKWDFQAVGADVKQDSIGRQQNVATLDLSVRATSSR